MLRRLRLDYKIRLVPDSSVIKSTSLHSKAEAMSDHDDDPFHLRWPWCSVAVDHAVRRLRLVDCCGFLNGNHILEVFAVWSYGLFLSMEFDHGAVRRMNSGYSMPIDAFVAIQCLHLVGCCCHLLLLIRILLASLHALVCLVGCCLLLSLIVHVCFNGVRSQWWRRSATVQ